MSMSLFAARTNSATYLFSATVVLFFPSTHVLFIKDKGFFLVWMLPSVQESRMLCVVYIGSISMWISTQAANSNDFESGTSFSSFMGWPAKQLGPCLVQLPYQGHQTVLVFFTLILTFKTAFSISWTHENISNNYSIFKHMFFFFHIYILHILYIIPTRYKMPILIGRHLLPFILVIF